MTICENCNQITDVVYLEISAPTMFDEIGFAGNVCCSCKSIIEWCIYQYLELFETLDKTVQKKRLALDSNTKRGMT